MLIAAVVHVEDDSMGGKEAAACWGCREQQSSVMPGHGEGARGGSLTWGDLAVRVAHRTRCLFVEVPQPTCTGGTGSPPALAPTPTPQPSPS